MLDSRLTAFALGVAGAVCGVAAVVFDAPSLGAAAGAAAIGAGALAQAGTGRRMQAGHDEGSTAPATALADTPDAVEAPTPATGAADTATQAAELTVLDGEPLREPSPSTDGGASGPSQSQPPPSHAATLTDTDSQLFSEAYFRVALQSRLASARRHLRPVSVCLMEVTEGLADALGGPPPAGRVADAIRETVREADIACRMDDGTFAVILEDTPENGAVWTVERTRRNLVSRFGTHTMWAGVACYPAHAFSGDELIDQARSALGSAQEWNQDRIEIAAADA